MLFSVFVMCTAQPYLIYQWSLVFVFGPGQWKYFFLDWDRSTAVLWYAAMYTATIGFGYVGSAIGKLMHRRQRVDAAALH